MKQRIRLMERINRSRINVCRYCGGQCMAGGVAGMPYVNDLCQACRMILIRRIEKGIKRQ